MDCHEIAELMTAAEKLAVMIENEEEIELDEDSDYGNINFLILQAHYCQC